MCGRFTLHHSVDDIVERFGVQETLFAPEPRYNVAPTQSVAAVTAEDGVRRLEGLHWGLVPFWARDPAIGNKMINARVETLAEKPAYKNAFLRRRCLIPADGFYEWRKEQGGKQPMHIRCRDADLFAFAGLYEEWKQGDGPPLRSCTIITVPANALVQPIHDRMPAMLRPEDEAHWLDTSVRDPMDLRSLLAPYPAQEMETFAVSKQVNSPATDDASFLLPLANSA